MIEIKLIKSRNTGADHWFKPASPTNGFMYFNRTTLLYFRLCEF